MPGDTFGVDVCDNEKRSTCIKDKQEKVSQKEAVHGILH